MLLFFAAIAIAQSEIPVIWTGERSKVTRKEIFLVTTPQDWTDAWLRSLGKPRRSNRIERSYPFYNEAGVPEVDFQSHVMVVLFAGNVAQQAGFSLLSAARTGSTLVIRYLPRSFSVAAPIAGRGGSPNPRSFDRTPYAFFLVRRGCSRIRLEEGIPHDKQAPITDFRFVKELVVPTTPR
jgi:hypothetical protein